MTDVPIRTHYTSRHLFALLSVRYPPGAYAVLSEVGNATGASVSRHADAIVMGLWPSRGLLIEGVEIKSTRGDWLRELQDPAKADPIAEKCDRWWVLAGPGVVKPEELPPGWGLIVPMPAGDKLRTVVEAATKAQEPTIGRPFLAAIMRTMVAQLVPAADVERRVKDEVDRRVAHETETLRCEYERSVDDRDRLLKNIKAFEAASGVTLDRYGERNGAIGEAVRAVLAGDSAIAEITHRLGWQTEGMARLGAELTKCAEFLRVGREALLARGATT
ncbi:MAG: hypothetical protein WC700_14970 [Gemmatimonadaceae bacterium]|jgi:hypothetical protein